MWLNIIIWMFFAITGAAVGQGFFQPIIVSSTTLETAGKRENLTTMSTLSCCVKASQQSWSHLACLGNDSVCSLYDIELSADYQEAEGEEEVVLNQCYRKMPGCLYENKTYNIGETVVKNCDQPSICTSIGWLHTICPVNYAYVSGNGCIKVVRKKLYNDASKAECSSQGAQLVISGDFDALRQYLQCAYPGANIFRAGLRNRKWNDGRRVAATEWGPGEPDYGGTNVCGYMMSGTGYKLEDARCNIVHNFICQKI